ncbi:hypothetical protein NPIL_288931, partial [Nephila pilipes]
MPLKNIPNKNRSRKHPGFNQASKAQRLRRKEEKRNRSSPNDNINENSLFQHINDHDLFARCDIAIQTDFGEGGLVYPACENKFKKCEVAVQTDPNQDVFHKDVIHQKPE